MDDAEIVGYNNENPPSKEDCLWEILPSRNNKLQISDFCTQKLFLQQMGVLKRRIPKQIMSLEEKYLRHCLELIHVSAMRANSWPPPSKVDIFPDRFSSRSRCDTLFLFSSEDENVVMNSSSDPIVGSITGSTSMINLLNSPLLCPVVPSDDDFPSEIQVKESLTCIVASSPKDDTSGYDSVHQRFVSISSTNSTFSDPSSSSSSSSSYSQGMLHCSWNNGFPRYVFSVEDQKEVYTTNLSKVNEEGLDYIYMFHDNESDLVAKMRVSTSFTLCPLGTQVMETRFILCAEEGIPVLPTSNQTVKKSKGLSKKMANIFRGNQSRQRTYSKFDGVFAVPDKFLEASEEGNVSQESAAIVVKDHIKKVEVGGWGLKFLKEGGNRQMNASPVRDSVSCEVCRQNNNQHSSSMDVVVPAGFHGGPRTKNGGPSSLVERWRSGGSCDCGGWDIGCPLTVLNAGPNYKDGLYQEGVFGKSNSFELFTQGCKQGVAAIEVRNIHDGLYYIHYHQSTLSALQSLSIAVAIIHSHSPTLKPKVYI